MIEKLGAKLIAILVAAALVVALLIFGPAACNSIRSQKAQNRMTTGQLGAAHESGADAVNTVGNEASNEAASADLTRSNEKEIRDAQGASDRVNPYVRSVGLRAFCRRQSTAGDPKCRVQQPAPR